MCSTTYIIIFVASIFIVGEKLSEIADVGWHNALLSLGGAGWKGNLLGRGDLLQWGFISQEFEENCQIYRDSNSSRLRSHDDNIDKAIIRSTNCYDDYNNNRRYGNVEYNNDSTYSVERLKTFCSESTWLTECVNPLINTLESRCRLTESMKKLMYPMKIFGQLTEFVCVKEMNRISQFIEEGGVECIDKQQATEICMNFTSSKSLVLFVKQSLDEAECIKLVPLRECVLDAVRTCPQPTTAFLVRSVTNIVLRNTPCKDSADDEDAATAACGSLALLAGGAALALLL